MAHHGAIPSCFRSDDEDPPGKLSSLFLPKESCQIYLTMFPVVKKPIFQNDKRGPLKAV